MFQLNIYLANTSNDQVMSSFKVNNQSRTFSNLYIGPHISHDHMNEQNLY